MKITVINGTEKHGATNQLKELFLSELKEQAQITEFYLPKDNPNFCIGCANCFSQGEKACKDSQYIQTIEQSLLSADLIVMTSPVYVFHATAAMKNLLDHFGYRWIPHRPAPQMFTKRAVIITQCLGAGAKTAAKDIRHSLSWWGISDITTATAALRRDIVWENLPQKTRAKLTKKFKKLSARFASVNYSKKPHIKFTTKFKFFVCRMLQKQLHRQDETYLDGNYWAAQGWLDKQRPWKANF